MKRELVFNFFYLAVLFFILICYHLSLELLLSFLSLGLLLLISLWFQKKQLVIPKTFSIVYLIFASFVTISNLFNGFNYSSFWEIVKLIDLYLVFVFNYNLLKNSKPYYDYILLFLVIISFFFAFDGILEFTGRAKELKWIGLIEPFRWPNLAASFYLFIFALVFFEIPQQKISKIANYFLFGLKYFILCAWLLTKSYLWGIPIFIGIAFLRNRKFIKESFKEWIFLSLLVLTTFSNFYFSFGPINFSDANSLFQNGLAFINQQDVLNFAFSNLNYYPWWGVGSNNFAYYYNEFVSQPWTWATYASSELIQTIIENGIFAFTAELCLFGYLIFCFFKKRGGKYYYLSLSLLLFVIIGQFNISFKILPLLVIFFGLLPTLIPDKATDITLNKYFQIPTLIFSFLFIFLFFGVINLEKSQLLIARREFAKAINLLENLSNYPILSLNSQIYYDLGLLKFRVKDTTGAINTLNKAYSLEKYDTEILFLFANIQLEEGNLEQAKTIIKNIINKRKYSPPKYYLLYLQILEKENQNDKINETVLLVNKLYPSKEELFNKEYLLEVNDYLPALRELSKYSN